MTTELDKNEEIGGSNDMGGFALPPEGNIAKETGVRMEFTGEIKLCGADNDCLQFILAYVDDPTAKANIFCKTSAQAGLTKIVGIGRDSGVFNKIDKKRIAQNKTPIQTSDGKVKVRILTDPKFHEQLRKEIEGCAILCTITHSEAKAYVDKDSGETKEGFPQANISKIAPAGGKFTPNTPGTPATEEKSVTAKEDDEDWD